MNEIATALAKAQGELKVAVKDTKNPFFKSKYADLTSVWGACREALSKNGLSVVQMPVDSPKEGYIALKTILLHSSGQSLESTVSAKPVKDDPQALGSAITYLRRYALAAFVGIVADDDDDGNAASYRANDPSRIVGADYEKLMKGTFGTPKYVEVINSIPGDHPYRAELLVLHRELTGKK